MRLDHLYAGKPGKVLSEDNAPPLEPSRYPPITEHVSASPFTPAIDVTTELKRLDQVARRDPMAAYRGIRDLVDMDLLTGLKGQANFYSKSAEMTSNGGVEPPNSVGEYLVAAADLDNTKILAEKSGLGHTGIASVLKLAGSLIQKAFANDPKVSVYRKHGDEFAIVRYIGDEDLAGAQAAFVNLLRKCILVANALASKGLSHEGWPPERRIQATISFGISTSDQSADGILTHLKSGDTSRRPLKYVVVVDRDLRNKLGLSVDDINRLKVQAPPEVGVVEVQPSETVFENASPVDEVREKPGAIIAECSWRDIPDQRKKELGSTRESKRRYLKEPIGAIVLDEKRGIYGPLKEQFKHRT